MKKKLLLTIVLLASFFLLSCSSEETEKYDTRAIQSLDAMSEKIGELSAASYTLNTVNVAADGTQARMEHDVYMRGPDKLYIHSAGTKGEISYWYDGKTLSYFSFDKNQYASVDAPETTLQTFAAIHDKFGIDFPAADFFYPSLTDDILDEYTQVLFAGEQEIDGKQTTAIYASNGDNILQIWISKATQLPMKFSIESNNDSATYYEATVSNFRMNPALPDIMFEFKPPSGSEQTSLKPLNKTK